MQNFYTCYVADLLIINKNSIAANYNRALRGNSEKKAINAVKSACRLHNIKYSKSIKVLVTPMMTHAFKAGVACEEHYRCVINFCDLNYSKAIIDVSKEDFKKYCIAHEAARKLIVNSHTKHC
jgi:hypothetical protein